MAIISLGARGTGVDWRLVRAGWGAQVRLHRQKAGLSQQQLADAVGATQSHICAIETRGRGIGDELRWALADALEVEVFDLFPYPARPGRRHTR
jgi:transcriptional regulator with XRE-family HTH domain